MQEMNHRDGYRLTDRRPQRPWSYCNLLRDDCMPNRGDEA